MKLLLALNTIEEIQDLIDKVNLNQVSLIEMLISMSISFVIGLLILVIYRSCFKGTVYNYSFNLSLLILTMITSLIILTISSNIVLSLGMVGALSIVRFRSAIKDPVDIVYIFWSIAVGLAVGASQYLLAFIGSLFIGLAFLILTRVKSNVSSYLITINYAVDYDNEVNCILRKFKTSTKSKFIKDNHIELIIEVRKKSQEIVDNLQALKIESISLFSLNE